MRAHHRSAFLETIAFPAAEKCVGGRKEVAEPVQLRLVIRREDVSHLLVVRRERICVTGKNHYTFVPPVIQHSVCGLFCLQHFAGKSISFQVCILAKFRGNSGGSLDLVLRRILFAKNNLAGQKASDKLYVSMDGLRTE